MFLSNVCFSLVFSECRSPIIDPTWASAAFENYSFGRHLKMGRPPFENYPAEGRTFLRTLRNSKPCVRDAFFWRFLHWLMFAIHNQIAHVYIRWLFMLKYFASESLFLSVNGIILLSDKFCFPSILQIEAVQWTVHRVSDLSYRSCCYSVLTKQKLCF